MHFAERPPKHSAQPPVMQYAYDHDMAISSVRHVRRKVNLERLVDDAGGATALAQLVGTPKSHISALLSGSRGIGDKLALKLERKCGKPDGWLDEQHDGEVLRQPDGYALVIDEMQATAFSLRPDRSELQLIHDLWLLPNEDRERIVRQVSERAADLMAHRQEADPWLKTIGGVIAEIARVCAGLPERARSHVAHLAGEMIQNGPDDAQVSAIDALAVIKEQHTLYRPPPLRSSVEVSKWADVGVEMIEALGDVAAASKKITRIQRQAMLSELRRIAKAGDDEAGPRTSAIEPPAPPAHLTPGKAASTPQASSAKRKRSA